MQNHKKNRIKIKLLIIILTIFISLLIYLALISQGNIKNPFVNIGSKKIYLDAKDNCAVIAGKLINQINNEGVCNNICHAECDSVKGELLNSEFLYGENQCNKCTCECEI